MPRELPAPASRSVIARRAATRSMVPLAVVVIAFFLPAARDCDEIVSPAQLSFKELPWFLWLAPVYLAAGLLLASIAYSRLRGRSPSGVLGIFAAFAVLVSCGFVAVVFLEKDAWPVMLGELVAFVLAALSIVKGVRRRGWMRLSAFGDAYLIGSAPVAVLNVVAGEYWGAWVFLAACAALVVIRALAFAAMFRAKCESESLARLDIQGPSLHG